MLLFVYKMTIKILMSLKGRTISRQSRKWMYSLYLYLYIANVELEEAENSFRSNGIVYISTL